MSKQESFGYFRSSITVENITFTIQTEEAQTYENELKEYLVKETAHIHPHNELFLCKKGTLRFRTENGIIELSSGDAVFIPARTPHYCAETGSDTVWATIEFRFSPVPGHGTEDIFGLFRPLAENPKPQILHNAAELYEELPPFRQAISKGDEITAALRAAVLLIRMAKLYQEQISVRKQNGKYAPLSSETRLNNLINAGFMECITVPELAEKLHLSPRQLSRLAKRIYGMPLTRVISEKRLAAAQNLLTTTNLPMSAIASSVGYSSLSNFYREFTEKYRIPPARYRKSDAADKNKL